MIEQNHTVTVLGVSWVDGQEDRIEQTYPCNFSQVGGKFFLLYEEPTDSGKTVRTLIKAEPGKFSLRRGENPASAMHFDQKKVTTCAYPTAVGTLPLEIYTDDIRFALTARGGKIVASYSLSQQGQLIRRNRIELRVSPRKK